MSECKTPTAEPEKSLERFFAELSFTPLLPPGVTIEIERAAEWAIAGAQLGTLVGEAAGSLAAAEVNEQIRWALLGDDR